MYRQIDEQTAVQLKHNIDTTSSSDILTSNKQYNCMQNKKNIYKKVLTFVYFSFCARFCVVPTALFIFHLVPSPLPVLLQNCFSPFLLPATTHACILVVLYFCISLLRSPPCYTAHIEEDLRYFYYYALHFRAHTHTHTCLCLFSFLLVPQHTFDLQFYHCACITYHPYICMECFTLHTHCIFLCLLFYYCTAVPLQTTCIYLYIHTLPHATGGFQSISVNPILFSL